MPGSSTSPGRSSASTADRITAADADQLFDAAEKAFAQPDWEKQVFAKTKLEKIFLTNEFDDPLEGFDTSTLRSVPADRHLVFHLDKPETRQRLAKATGRRGPRRRDAAEGDPAMLFEHFTRKGAKACAISLPPNFDPAITTTSTSTNRCASTTATTSARASSGCSPSTAASSSCRST